MPRKKTNQFIPSVSLPDDLIDSNVYVAYRRECKFYEVGDKDTGQIYGTPILWVSVLELARKHVRYTEQDRSKPW